MSDGERGSRPGRLAVVVACLVVAALVVPALALTAVRVLPLESGPAIRLASFAPFATVLYAAALVVLLGLLVRGRRRAGRGVVRRRAPALGVVVAAAGLVAHGWWAAPLWWGETPAPAEGATPITVMTANLRLGEADPAELVATVRDEGVEVLVLEEVSEALLPELEAEGLTELLPHRIGAPVPHDVVGGTLVLSTLPLGDPTYVGTFHQSWLVTAGAGSAAITVLAVHPVSPVDTPRWHDEHELLLATAERARPDLVVGDFNATSDHRPIRALAAAGFSDAARLADSGWQPTWPANGLGPDIPLGLGPHLVPVVAIDHVLLDDDWTALSTHTREIAGTDHLALVAEVARR